MSIQLHHRPLDAQSGYSWTITLPRPPGPERQLAPSVMNASELMFFYGAPLAHIVAYEEELRAARRGKALRALTRARRPANFVVPIEELISEPPLLVANHA